MPSYKNKKNKIRIKAINEVQCAVLGIRPEHQKICYDEFGILVPNYFFNPLVKLKKWDGRQRFFKKSGDTYMALLPRIVELLETHGYEIDIDMSALKSPFIKIPKIDENFFHHAEIVLRDYQVEAINALTDAGSGVILAGTGAGKTLINAAVASLYEQYGTNTRTITVVPTKDLVRQTEGVFKKVGLDVGVFGGSRKDLDHTHIVSTWQSLYRTPQILADFNVLMVDEGHTIKGAELFKLATEHGGHIVHRFGWTGTLPKEECDKMNMRVALGSVHYEVPAHVLIERGFLADPNIFIYQTITEFKEDYQEYLEGHEMLHPKDKPATYTQFKKDLLPEYTNEKKFLHDYKQRNLFITDLITSIREQEKGNTFVLVNGVPYGRKIANAIEGAVFIESIWEEEERWSHYDKFEVNNHEVAVATAQLVQMGLDIPRIFKIVMIDMGKAWTKTIQSIGRGLRKADDKDSIDIIDISDSLRYNARHMNQRIAYYKEQKYPYEVYKLEL